MRGISKLFVVSFFVASFVLVTSGNKVFAAELPPHKVVFTDGTNIYLADIDNPGRVVSLTADLPESGMYYDHPCVAGNTLWYDRTQTRRGYSQRLYKSKWMDGAATVQKTSDPWGNSTDTNPIASSFLPDVIFYTNRKGVTMMDLASSGKLGPGYGHSVFDTGAACWDLTLEDKNIAYVAPNEEHEVVVSPGVLALMYGTDGIYAWDHRKSTKTAEFIPFKDDESLVIYVERLSVTVDQRFLISDGESLYFLVPGKDAKQLAPTNVGEGIISPDGTKVLYVVVDGDYTSVVSADIDQVGELSNAFTVAETASGDILSESVSPSWAPDDMFVSCDKVSGKLNFAVRGKDSLSLSGSVIVPEGTNYDTAKVTIGNFSRTFRLNQKEDKLKLSSVAPVTGAPKVRTWSVTTSGDLTAAFAALGFTNSDTKSSGEFDLTITFSGSASDTYTLTKQLKYTARAGKSGSLTD